MVTQILDYLKSKTRSEATTGGQSQTSSSPDPLDSGACDSREVAPDAPEASTQPQGGGEAECGEDIAVPGSISLRSLRIGPFDFDSPEVNTRVSDGNSNSHATNPDFPPLFREADDMLALASLIYTLVELRNAARNGSLAEPANSKRILDLPLPLDTALELIAIEGESLKEALADGEHEATLSALKGLMESQRRRRTALQASEDAQGRAENESGKKPEESGFVEMFSKMIKWDSSPSGVELEQKAPPSSVLTAVGDSKSNEELVYAVGINPVEKRITVVFRGSVTKTDFITDANIAIVKMPDPRTFHGTEGNNFTGGDVGVHQGFKDYLFGKSGEKTSKYDEIMEHIESLLEENPARRSYRLYITGHSLGGALATLFGFYVAASTILPLPTTIVSVASPRVGNVAFAETFAELESQGKIRHLRIANDKDPVTLGPTFSSKRALALSAKMVSPLGYLVLKLTGNDEGGEEEVYYHTGMKLKLFRKCSGEASQLSVISYSGAAVISGSKKPVAFDNDEVAEIEHSNKRVKRQSAPELPMASYHYTMTYTERLAASELELEGLTLNNLYLEKASKPH